MRQLKFRVWDINKKIFLVKDCPLLEVAFRAGQGNDLQNIVIQQYTGLKDKNGKDIYEGDILKELVNNESSFEIGTCKEVLGGWDIFNIKESNICWHGWKQEVIGNIYENPELLK